ncbi:hypothetical protein BJ138DRAFT_1107200 [Hygrophoropsis aurantiaca]|uniref:Uncharacterized protein n=1 Tax=Hygrophoropsis aurantiaca TaxID=72124 RepID=A0ACB7ZT04_9AGAM|nr:hypothetical protein BJ138DRAFT_1107200 [Hygrophoropsis aurantiaca]
MADHIICKGCNRRFTLSGHNRHLAQTSNPQCIAIHQELYNYLPDSDSDGDEAYPSPSIDLPGGFEPDDDNDNMPVDPDGSFRGDYFGTYKEDEINWPDDGEYSSGTEEPDDGSDESDEEVGSFEGDGNESLDRLACAAGDMEHLERDDDESIPGEHGEPEDPENLANRQVRDHAEQQLGRGPYIDVFPRASAGAVLNRTRKNVYKSYQDDLQQPTNRWAPFASQIDYELARWAKLRGSGSTAFSDLLKIDGLCEKLGLSYKDSRQLNQIIDKKLPTRRPQFQREEIEIAGESYDVYFRDILECVKALYGDPEFARYLVFTPERHYSDANRTMRMYHDLHTGKWWWDTQTKRK